jgi:hypothetical protein
MGFIYNFIFAVIVCLQKSPCVRLLEGRLIVFGGVLLGLVNWSSKIGDHDLSNFGHEFHLKFEPLIYYYDESFD